MMRLSSACLGLVCAAGFAACEMAASAKTGLERWIALSRTATAITGDIVLSPTQLRTEAASFSLKVARD
ncbi:MAG: hypothetical protein ACJ8E9_06925, partial [Sphingomicrobium sp.]